MPFSDYLAGRGLKSDDFCFHFQRTPGKVQASGALPVLLTRSFLSLLSTGEGTAIREESRLFFPTAKLSCASYFMASTRCVYYSLKFSCDKFELLG